ncbi:MAG: FAD-dependent thymidylate synthase [candidate division NC10 bacterium]|nr:FAD-dependent thymidylate synthase [candidate division NC10 bacterium]
MKPVTSKVALVAFTPDPEQVIAAAGKLCYSQETEGIFDPSPKEAQQFVRRLRSWGHLSPLEHASFTFCLEGVSRAMTHQLVRHRIASYSQRSQRYVEEGDFDYILPPRVKGKRISFEGKEWKGEEFFRQTMEMIGQRYRALDLALGGAGESSHEDARYLLPNACESKIFVTMNARQLLHFFGERLCNRAQWEIREVAQKMLNLLRPAYPGIFGGAGPKCIERGGCPEGKRGCGKWEEVRERYREQPL